MTTKITSGVKRPEPFERLGGVRFRRVAHLARPAAIANREEDQQARHQQRHRPADGQQEEKEQVDLPGGGRCFLRKQGDLGKHHGLSPRASVAGSRAGALLCCGGSRAARSLAALADRTRNQTMPTSPTIVNTPPTRTNFSMFAVYLPVWGS